MTQSQNTIHILPVTREDEGMRLDQFVVNKITSESRAFIQKLILNHKITIDSDSKKGSYKIRSGQTVQVDLPVPVELEVAASDIHLDILYEDDCIIVLNKSSSMVVHPAPGHSDDTIVNALMFHCKGKLSSIGGVLRPGIVHRLDKDTSGCLVIAKNDYSHRNIAEQFQRRIVKKEYYALVSGWVKEMKGTIDISVGRHPIHRKKMTAVNPVQGGRKALTEYSVIERYSAGSLLSVYIHTGRTHQIRVHTARMGYPILGDNVYGNKQARLRGYGVNRQMLHSYKIGFNHPKSNEWVEFRAPMPEDMEKTLAFLRKTNSIKGDE